MELRPYQSQAVSDILADFSRTGNSIVSLPTGAGKSIVIAEAVKKLDMPTLIFQPSKEILEQNVAKLSFFVPRDQIGIYSASANEKTIHRYTFATIGSVYRTPEHFTDFRHIILDECHGFSPKDTDTMFHQFLSHLNYPKVIGLTATPFRQDTAWKNYGTTDAMEYMTTKILTRMGKKPFWSRIIHNTTIRTLMDDGYLTPLTYFNNSNIKHETLPRNKSHTDFDLEAFESIIANEEEKILDAVARLQAVSHSVLVFCASVEQATRFASVTKGSAVVSAMTKPKDRTAILSGFKTGSIKTVYNCGVLTTGFDHPELDAIVTIRPTRSLALWYQMLGRGVRVAPNKKTCRVVDFSGNVRSMGTIESIRLIQRPQWDVENNMGCWHGRYLYPIIRPS